MASAGFVIMTIAAVFSTTSSVISQFFATTSVVSYLTKIGQFPHLLGRQAGKYGNVGTVISTIIVCALTLLFDLSAIASIGSAVGLVVFLMVDVAHVKLAKETKANLPIVYLSIVTVVITLLVFTFETLIDEPGTAIALVVFLALAVLVDRFWRAVPYLRAGDAGATAAADLS